MLTRPTPFCPHAQREALVRVAQLYRLLLRRPADRDGLLLHADLLLDGETLESVVHAVRDSDEARHLWRGVPDRDVAHALWLRRAGDASDPGIAAPGFTHAWQEAGGLAPFLASLLAQEAVHRTPVLPLLFPRGIDTVGPDADPGWAYRLWAAETERCVAEGVQSRLRHLHRHGPLIELVIHADPEQSADLAADTTRTIASLQNQLYPHWRLSLQAPLPPELALLDPRITAGPVNAATTWRGWLQAGDQLTPSALALFADATLRHRRAALIYCDEDRILADGSRMMPVLKTAWDPHASLQAGVGALALYRAGHPATRAADPDKSPLDRLHAATRSIPDRRVVHLPAILCHRPAGNPPPMPAAPLATPSATPSRPSVSVVIATRDQAPLLERCVRSLRDNTRYPSPPQIVLVDNGSTAPDALALLDRLEASGCRLLRRPGPFNWSALNNDGVRAASGEIVVLMNNDVECIEPGWLEAMVSACLLPGVGVVGALLLFPGGAVQHAGIVVGPGPDAVHAAFDRDRPGPALRNVAAVTGACMAVRRRLFKTLGGLDAASLPVTWNDIDFCLRARARGLRVLLARDAVLVHDESATRTADKAEENRAQLARTRAVVARRHRRALARSPYLNPQATLAGGGRLLDPDAPRTLWTTLRRR